MIGPGTAIVFTTAYSEHALESYDVNAADYLLKPISLERFSKTIAKLTNILENAPSPTTGSLMAPRTLFIKSGLETHQVKLDDITHLKKDGNYIYYFVKDKKIMARQSVPEALDGFK